MDMRIKEMKKSVIDAVGLVMFLFVLAVLLRWNLNQTITAYAFSQTDAIQGTMLDNTEIESGYIVDADTGITLYYQIHGEKEDRQVAISGYKYEGQERITLYLPAYIMHGELDTTQEKYTVVGVNGGVFTGFIYLQSVVFPSTYEWIGASAFKNCAIENVNLLGVKQIYQEAFYGCPLSGGVMIGPGTNSIGPGAFANCSNLNAISVDGGNQKYCAERGVLYTKNKDMLIQWPAALTVGDSITGVCEIGSEALPIRFIGDRAFEGCQSLREISGIFSSVTTIGERAFYGCSSLSRAKIPSTVVLINQDAFANCSPSLVFECEKSSQAEFYAQSHGIQALVTCIVKFYDGTKLVKTQAVPVGSDATAPTVSDRAGYTLTWDKEYTNVQQNLDVYTAWKQNLTVTFKDAYSGQTMEVVSYFGGSVEPPVWTREGYILGWDSTAYQYVKKNVTVNTVWLVSMTGGIITEERPQLGDTRTINYVTYQVTRTDESDPRVKAVGCTKQTLTTLVIPDTITFGGVCYKVTNIGANAFRDMPKLTTLVIGKNVSKINRAAFYNCPKLKSITIKTRSLSSVEEKAFSKIYVKAKVNVINAYVKKYKSYLQDAGLSIYAKVF